MAKNLYEILGVTKDATEEEIISAYASQKNKLHLARNSGTMETDEFLTKLSELDNAKCTLIDKDRRQAYDAGTPAQATGAKKGKNKNKKTLLKRLAVGACATAVAVSLIACTAQKLSKEQVNDEPSISTTAEPTTTPTTEPTTAPTTEPTTAPTTEPTTEPTTTPDPTAEPTTTPEPTTAPVVDSTVPEIVNYGNAKDDAVVTERATKLLNELNAAGLYNMGTNAPYTVDELKTLIQYINGAYKPQNEDEAYTLVDEVLNFALAPLNSEQVLYSVQYQGGEDSFKDTVQGYIDNYQPIHFVDNMLLGNSSAYPYLKWFENQYNAMLCTTDREECARIFNSMIQSLADMVVGNGFTLDGKTYDKNDFLGLDRVNSGNLLQILVYIMEPFRTNYCQDDFIVHDKFISANPDENQVTVNIDQLLEYFNAICEDDLQPIAVDDEGLLLIDEPDGKNFSYINQVNTINCALMEYYGKDNAYTNVYQKQLN